MSTDRISRPGKMQPPPVTPGRAARLPYSVELWNPRRTAPERILARAASLTIARTIFVTAEAEQLGRRIVLRRGAAVVQESG